MDKSSFAIPGYPGFRDSPSSEPRQTAFHVLRILFGLIWLFNALYQLHPAYINGLFLKSIAAHPGQSAWYISYTQWATGVIASLGSSNVALVIALSGFMLALSLLTGIALRAMCWFGAIFSLIMWTLNGHLGGPYTAGATDPGTLIVYSLTFLTVLAVEPRTGQWNRPDSRLKRYQLVRLLFGLLWAFDAAWKWTPFFLHHPLSYLVQSQAGQPAWIVAYIQFFINVIQLIGQEPFGIFVAISETLIAISLITGRGLRYLLPFSLAYCLGLWTTAEGWGGPYTAVTGVGGDVLGTGIIYALICLYLMVMYLPDKLRQTPE